MPKKGDLAYSRDLVREKWLRGRLNYKLHAGQMKIERAVNASTHQLFVGELSRQFGKTFWLVKRALEAAFRIPKAKIKIGTAFHTDLLEFILPAFDTVLEDCPADLKPVWKSQRSKFILPHNGSEIKLIGLDRKPNGLRGNVIDLIILDETAFMNRLDYLYKSVIIPATTHRPNCKVFLFSTPPDTPAHDFLGYVERAEFEGNYIKLTIFDNPMVDETTIARLMKESGGAHSTTWKREYLCQHITDQDLAIIPEWKDEYVREIPRDAYYGFYHRYVAMDLGVRDHTAVLLGYYDFRLATLVIEDEFVMNGPEMTTQKLADAIDQKQSDRWDEMSVYRRVSDNNNPLLLQDLSLIHGIYFSPTDKGTLEEMINTLRLLVAEGRIVVHPRCKQMRGCLKYGVWDNKRSKFAHSKVYGHFDALAALVYWVRNLNKSTNPVPPNFQVDPDHQIFFSQIHDTDNVRTLKNAFGLK